MSGSAAERYAEALLESVWDKGGETRSAVAEELKQLAGFMDEVFDLRNALVNPSYSTEERIRTLDAVTEKLGLSEPVRTFSRLVVERGRASEIAAIAEAFSKLLDERSDRLHAVVSSASALDEDAARHIREALERRTGKSIEMELNVDPDLIGGIRAEVGTLVFDGSIRAELDRLRTQLQQS